MNKLIILVILIIIVIATIGLINFMRPDDNDNNGDYMDVYYNFTIDIENNADFLIYAPIPTNVDNRNSPNPLVNELMYEGNISSSVKTIDTPLGNSIVLELIGSGKSEINYKRLFWENSSDEKLSNRVYQISNLYLLKEWDTVIVYFNSSNVKNCTISFNAGYIDYSDGDEWQSYWKTFSDETLNLGWNEIVLDHRFDGDV